MVSLHYLHKAIGLDVVLVYASVSQFFTHCGAGGGSATVYEKGKIINHPSDYCSSGLAYVYPLEEGVVGLHLYIYIYI